MKTNLLLATGVPRLDCDTNENNNRKQKCVPLEAKEADPSERERGKIEKQ